MDSLEIIGLKIKGHIGVYEWEQRILQTLIIDVHIPFDFSQTTENLEDTLDYAQLCGEINDFIESKPFYLIETVANEIAQLIKDKYFIESVTVSVAKPNAVKSAANVKVTARR